MTITLLAIRTVAMTILSVASPSMSAQATGAASAPSERPHLDAAIAVARHLRSVRVATAHGAAWPADPAEPARMPRDLYHGTGGGILFHLALWRATGDDAHRAEAEAGASEILMGIESERDHGLFTGLAGEGAVLLAALRATGDERWRAGARRCADRLRAETRPAGGGVAWNGTTDLIAGSAGIGLFLLEAARGLGDESFVDLAVAAGDGLLAAAPPRAGADGAPTRDWLMASGDERRMPNLSHGTAGVGYFLLALHEAIAQRAGAGGPAADDRFLQAALDGARHLASIADERGLVFHHAPGGERLFYLGWCHGPAGTGRFLLRLADVTGDERWSAMARRAGAAVRGCGIPAQRPEGFWNNAGVCCGSAGAAAFALDLHRRFGDPADLAFARELTADLMARASVADAPGGRALSWSHAEHRVRPEELSGQSGLMQGAAGIGLWLLTLDAAERGAPAPLGELLPGCLPVLSE
jgi:lantibiotic modifying enzyme